MHIKTNVDAQNRKVDIEIQHDIVLQPSLFSLTFAQWKLITAKVLEAEVVKEQEAKQRVLQRA